MQKERPDPKLQAATANGPVRSSLNSISRTIIRSPDETAYQPDTSTDRAAAVAQRSIVAMIQSA